MSIEAILLLYLPSTAKEAREIGSKFYFTGKPCKRGHICKIFTNRWNCSECMIERDKEWRAENKDKVREINNKATKKWRDNNKERKYEMNKNWVKNNPEKAREKYRRCAKIYKKTSGGKLRDQCYNTARRLGLGKLSESKFKLLQYTPEEYKEYLLKNLPFNSLQQAYDKDYHLDHIVCIKFISNNIPDRILAFKVCMDLMNLRLIHKKENHKKHDKTDLPIVQETIEYLWNKYGLPQFLDK